MKPCSLSAALARCLASLVLLALPSVPSHFPPQPEPIETLALMPDDPIAKHFLGISLPHDGNIPDFMRT